MLKGKPICKTFFSIRTFPGSLRRIPGISPLIFFYVGPVAWKVSEEFLQSIFIGSMAVLFIRIPVPH